MLFGKDFYPTPDHVIEGMVAPYNIQNAVIYDPQAGIGAILDYCKLHDVKECIASEIEEELRAIIKSKEHRLIGTDFLQVSSDQISHVNFIFMNPPFSNEEDHILHALEIAPEGCQIVSLCNSEMIENTYSRKRKRISTHIQNLGTFENLGSVFANADRPTDCEIGLIRLYKPKTSASDAEWEGFFTEEVEEDQYNGIMPYNFVRDVVNRYVGAVKLFDQQLELAVKMNNLTGSFFSGKMAMSMTSKEAPVTRADYKKDLQKNAWNFVFKQMNMDKYMTKSVKDDINKFVETQEKIPFSMPNIYKMLDIIIGTQSSRMDKALLEVFDKLTAHHDENRMNLEGWKTNGYYLVNRKFIFPWMTDSEYGRGKMEVKYGYGNSNIDIIDDLMRFLCMLNGDNYDKKVTLHSFVNRAYTNKEGEEVYSVYGGDRKYREWGQWYEWEYFRIKGYKKGTMHFEFLDERLWNKFNAAVGKLKGYVLYESKPKSNPTPKPTKSKSRVRNTGDFQILATIKI